MPVEVLHTKLLGTCKYVLNEVMSGLSRRQKSEILARVKAFNTSGFKTKNVWKCLPVLQVICWEGILKDGPRWQCSLWDRI